MVSCPAPSRHGSDGPAWLLRARNNTEVSWAIRAHQALRFYPDESVGYDYPGAYVKMFGPDYRPDPYIVSCLLATARVAAM